MFSLYSSFLLFLSFVLFFDKIQKLGANFCHLYRRVVLHTWTHFLVRISQTKNAEIFMSGFGFFGQRNSRGKRENRALLATLRYMYIVHVNGKKATVSSILNCDSTFNVLYQCVYECVFSSHFFWMDWAHCESFAWTTANCWNSAFNSRSILLVLLKNWIKEQKTIWMCIDMVSVCKRRKCLENCCIK